MPYIDNPVTDSERSGLYHTAIGGLVASLVSLGLQLSPYRGPYIWLVLAFAGSCLFLLAFNWRARDEYFDRLSLAGARTALGLLGVWVCIEAMIYLFVGDRGMQPAFPLRNQMISFAAIMTAYFGGFTFAWWRSR